MNKKYEDLCKYVIDYIGGKDNISFFTHCVTRLRFTIKDKEKVDDNKIKDLEGCLGVIWAGEQLQVVIGGAVNDVYKEICTRYGFNTEKAVEEKSEESKDKKKKISVNKIFDTIAGCVTPVIPVFMACGLIKLLVTVLGWCGVGADNSTVQILTIVGDAGFYFLPVLVGVFSAKKFGANLALGAVVGAMLIHPDFISLVNDGAAISFLRIPVTGASYSSTVIPVILAVAVMAPIERKLAKIFPESLKPMLEPFLTLLIMVPLTFCLLAPIGSILGNFLSVAVTWLYDTVGFLGLAIFLCIWPLMVMTGMHVAMVPYMVNAFATVGYDMLLLTTNYVSNMSIGAAAFGVALRSKDKKLKSIASASAVTAILGGVTEPALYGVHVKIKKSLYATMIGNFIGGIIAGLGKAAAYVPTTTSFLGFTMYLQGGASNVFWILAAVIIGSIASFIIAFITYREESL